MDRDTPDPPDSERPGEGHEDGRGDEPELTELSGSGTAQLERPRTKAKRGRRIRPGPDDALPPPGPAPQPKRDKSSQGTPGASVLREADPEALFWISTIVGWTIVVGLFFVGLSWYIEPQEERQLTLQELALFQQRLVAEFGAEDWLVGSALCLPDPRELTIFFKRGEDTRSRTEEVLDRMPELRFAVESMGEVVMLDTTVGVPIGSKTKRSDLDSWGTLGVRVKDKDGTVYAMSNNHVYARLGRPGVCRGDPIEAYGSPDDHRACADALRKKYGSKIKIKSRYTIGDLAHWFPIWSGGHASNRVDAAIARTVDECVDTATPDNRTPKRDYVSTTELKQWVCEQKKTLTVTKRGWETRTVGRVQCVQGSFHRVCLTGAGSPRCDYRSFVDQIVIEGNTGPFSEAGDSGSLVTLYRVGALDDRRPVGLIMGRDTDTGWSIANPIEEVLCCLKVGIDDGSAAPAEIPQVCECNPPPPDALFRILP